jgi:hypothetical protein
MGDLQLAIGTAEDLAADQDLLPEVGDPRNRDDDPHPDEEPLQIPATETPTEVSVAEAERVEIWVDEELRWWWRAIRDDGSICASGSGVNEATVLGAADAAYPGVMPYLIPSERHDSRDIRQYTAPKRLPPGVI